MISAEPSYKKNDDTDAAILTCMVTQPKPKVKIPITDNADLVIILNRVWDIPYWHH